jgi:uncharacterized protein YjbI with pentapeptide repeats
MSQDFSLQDFSFQDIEAVSFENANLEGASFRGSNITNVCFENANLLGANFSGATISDSSFEGAKLGYSNISEASIFANLVSTTFWIFISYFLGDSNSLYGHSSSSSKIAILFLLSCFTFFTIIYFLWQHFTSNLLLDKNLSILIIFLTILNGILFTAFLNFLNKEISISKMTQFTNSKLVRIKFTSNLDTLENVDLSGASLVECSSRD